MFGEYTASAFGPEDRGGMFLPNKKEIKKNKTYEY
jgi:hypothetical protein